MKAIPALWDDAGACLSACAPVVAALEEMHPTRCSAWQRIFCSNCRHRSWGLCEGGETSTEDDVQLRALISPSANIFFDMAAAGSKISSTAASCQASCAICRPIGSQEPHLPLPAPPGRPDADIFYLERPAYGQELMIAEPGTFTIT